MKLESAFQRGLNIFIGEYDRQNPNNPLKQINVGMRSNRLKRQSESKRKSFFQKELRDVHKK